MSERTTMNSKPVFTVLARTIINFNSGFGHKLLCDDMTFTTGSACAYSCSFCYVEAMQRKQQEWFKEHGVEYPAEGHAGVVIRNENPIEIARKQIMSKSEAFRMSPNVIYSSPKVDVAANMELVRETVEMCKMILTETAWHIRLLSKSNLLPKIAQALSGWGLITQDVAKARIIYGVSTGTLDDKLAQAFEEGCPLVSKRIQSLHWLQDNGFRTFGMVCPSLPQVDYNVFAANILDAIRWHRCEHVWAEVINVRGNSFTKTMKVLKDGGFNQEAARVEAVSSDPEAWEDYARQTFHAEAEHMRDPYKLRFLQYVNNSNREFWEANRQRGAVLL